MSETPGGDHRPPSLPRPDSTERTLQMLYASPPPAISRSRAHRQQRRAWVVVAVALSLAAVATVPRLGVGSDAAAVTAGTTTTTALFYDDFLLPTIERPVVPDPDPGTPGTLPDAAGGGPVRPRTGTSRPTAVAYREASGLYSVRVGSDWVPFDARVQGNKGTWRAWRVGSALGPDTTTVVIYTVNVPGATIEQILASARSAAEKSLSTVESASVITTQSGTAAGRIVVRASRKVAGIGDLPFEDDFIFVPADDKFVVVHASGLAAASAARQAATDPYLLSIKVPG